MIKDWLPTEKPRERLLQNGPKSLSDAELLSILLRTGIHGKNAIELSRDVLSHCGGLRGLSQWRDREKKVFAGLGPAKRASIDAAFELGRRLLREKAIGRHAFREPEAVHNYLKSAIRDETVEVFKVLFLNKANELFDELDLFQGTVDQSAVYVREVIKIALEKHATGIIVAHNHPSGRAEPSTEDRNITHILKSACDTVQVKLLDHLIVAGSDYFSFRENGFLK